MKSYTFPILFALLTYFVPMVGVKAVVPPPDGGYPGFTTAEGQNALQHLTTGVGNTAAGWYSLFANSVGNLNTAIGAGTLLSNTGDNNTAIGALALLSNTTGSGNIGLGVSAGDNITGNNNIDIGNNGVASDNGVIRIGDGQFATYIAGIAGHEAGCDSPFIAVDPNGHLGIPRCMSGAPLSFNDLRQEHEKVEEQQATITELKSIVAQQQKAMEVLTAQLKEQAAQIQKVSAQLEVSKAAPQTVLNNQ